jgi:hypothetical protein
MVTIRTQSEAISEARISSTLHGYEIEQENYMSDCLHCDIHELLESRLQGQEANLAEIAAKVTEVLADLVLLAPIEERGKLIADILANLGEFVLQKGEDAAPQTDPRKH